MIIYVATYDTESGDSGVVGYFTKEPTEGQLTAYFKRLMPDEFIKHAGEERRYVFWSVSQLAEERLPKPIKPVETI